MKNPLRCHHARRESGDEPFRRMHAAEPGGELAEAEAYEQGEADAEALANFR